MSYKFSKWIGLVMATTFITIAYADHLRTVTLPFYEEEITRDKGLTFNYDLTSPNPQTHRNLVCLVHHAERASFTWPHEHHTNPAAPTTPTPTEVGHHSLTLNEGKVVFITGETDVDVDYPAHIRHADVKGTISITTQNQFYKIFDNNVPMPYQASVCCYYEDVGH